MQPNRILLVEDEQFIRDIYKRQLEKEGFMVDCFSNGQDALNSVAQNTYNLALLDIMLPEMNGLEILKKIKQNVITQKIPVVMLTNLGQEEIIKEGFTLGAQGYLIKASCSPNQVVQEVNNILGKTRPQSI